VAFSRTQRLAAFVGGGDADICSDRTSERAPVTSKNVRNDNSAPKTFLVVRFVGVLETNMLGNICVAFADKILAEVWMES
jgi:hypothetical protein